jgi:hypothetical protein
MTNNRFLRVLGACAISVAIGGSLIAAGLDAPNTADQQFTSQAMQSLLQNVSNADAAQTSGDAATKQLAGTLQTDQIAIGSQLASLASYYGINVSTNAPKASTDGAGYAADQKASLTKLIAIFQTEQQNVDGASQLRSFAAQSLPILEKDLSAIQ